MKSFMQSAAFVWAIGLAAFVLGPARADAQDGLHGSWQDRLPFHDIWDGFYQSDVNPRITGPAELGILKQDNHRFAGEIKMCPVVCPADPTRGTISARGEVTFVWETGEAHGMVVIDSSVGEVMLLEYRVRLTDGSTDRGTLVLLPAIQRPGS
jgi:hypothetical protein